MARAKVIYKFKDDVVACFKHAMGAAVVPFVLRVGAPQ